MKWLGQMSNGRMFGAGTLIAISLMVILGAAPAAADAACTTPNVLSGSNFEIDLSANLKVDGASPCIDWLAGGSGSGLRSGVLAKSDKASGTNDDSFGQGTKEDDPNPTIVTGSIPNNKSDLKVFGVFTETAASAHFLELFWSRINSPQGTTNMDFELNQKFCDPTATPTNCANNGTGVTPETPVRTNGDKLITYDLAQGGTVPTISIRTWNGSTSVWGPPTVISGGANPLALGSINTSPIAAADAGGIGALDPLTFGEAAINFSALFPSGGQCGAFGSAYLKSRASTSFTAEVKDFVAPEKVSITNCTNLTTSATSPVTIGSPIHDTATLTGATANATGTITFHLFTDAGCTNASEVNTGLSPVTVNGNGDYNSGNFTPTAVGTYYWTAHYSGDLSNAVSDSPCGAANESSVVNKASPALTTSASGPVTVGSPIHDTATLTGGVGPTGTITFHLFTDSGCTNEVSTGLTAVTVSGNGAYGSGGFTPATAGTYYWTASYSGDANNQAASTSCGDANESSVVNKASPALTTSASGPVTVGSPISDTATLTGGVGPTGTITFHLFTDSGCTNEVSTGLTAVTVSGNGAYGSGGFTPATAGTYYWTASYSGDANNQAASTSCGDLLESSVVNKASPALTTTATQSVTVGSPISDTATLTGGVGPTGTITFHLFTDSGCTSEVSTGLTPVTVSGNGSYTSGGFTPSAAGTYYWTASYSGDANNQAASTSCGDLLESSVVNKASPALTTTATQSVTVGSPISDTATLTGGVGPTGTITFHLFTDSGCTSEVSTGLTPVTVSGNGSYTSGGFTPSAAGTYYWTASYSGDANNQPASTSCGDLLESSVVNKASPALTTTATQSVTIDSPISDVATLSGASSNAGGTITFHLFTDNQCQNEVSAGLTPVTVSGNGAYPSGGFTPTAVGTYYWTASYSGDANNQPVSTSCGDANESSMVTKAPSSISTAQELFPQDSGTVSAGAGGTPTGSVTFELFGPNNPTCDAAGVSPVYTQTVPLSSGSASTSNTTFSVKSASSDDYKWLVAYSGDSTHEGATSACGTEHFTLTIATASRNLRVMPQPAA